MRIVVAFCLATGPFMVWGWPSHWWLACSSFAAGMAGRGARTAGRRRRRGGALRPPASPAPSQATPSMSDLTRRIEGYSRSPGAPGVRSVVEAILQPPPAASSSTEHGSSTDATAAPGASGLQREAAAYRDRLTHRQRLVLDELVAEGAILGHVPDDAAERMAPFGPWPDPLTGGCEGCLEP